MRLPGGVEQLFMAYNKLPDVCQVVHAVTLLHQNLLCVSATHRRVMKAACCP